MNLTQIIHILQDKDEINMDIQVLETQEKHLQVCWIKIVLCLLQRLKKDY